MADKVERIYTVPLGDAYRAVRKKRAGRAVRILREFAGKHMKADMEDVSLSNALNSFIWKDSIQKPPRKIKVRLIKEDGQVKAYLADEKIEEKKPEPKKEEKKKEEPKKEEKPKEEAKKPPEVEEKEKEAKKEQTVKAEAAMAKKEADKAIKAEESKIEEAQKRKFTHGKETQ